MNFGELQNEVIEFRFGEHRRHSVRMWINMRYTEVNAMNDWPWTVPLQSTVTVSSGEGALPTGAVRLLEVYDPAAALRLEYMPYEDLHALYFDSDPDTGDPERYSVKAPATLVVAPTPGGDFTLDVTYQDRPIMLEDDNDEPAWPEEYHYALVMGACATGLKLENDPTFEPLEGEFYAMVNAMKTEMVPAHIAENRQYGRDMLGYDGWR